MEKSNAGLVYQTIKKVSLLTKRIEELEKTVIILQEKIKI